MDIPAQETLEEWNDWKGGMMPVAVDAPVTMLWPNGIQRTYQRGDHIMWINLPKNGTVKWRLPEPTNVACAMKVGLRL